MLSAVSCTSQGLIADEFVLQLTTFLRSLDLFLELIVLTTSTLTANQVRLTAGCCGASSSNVRPQSSAAFRLLWNTKSGWAFGSRAASCVSAVLGQVVT